MYVTTEKFCQAEADVWKDIPAYGKARNRLGEIIAELNKHNFKLQGEHGTSNTKSAKRLEMEQLVGRGLRAYAAATRNQTLISDTNVILKQIALAN